MSGQPTINISYVRSAYNQHIICQVSLQSTYHMSGQPTINISYVRSAYNQHIICQVSLQSTYHMSGQPTINISYETLMCLMLMISKCYEQNPYQFIKKT